MIKSRYINGWTTCNGLVLPLKEAVVRDKLQIQAFMRP